jgi:hypothetical protein
MRIRRRRLRDWGTRSKEAVSGLVVPSRTRERPRWRLTSCGICPCTGTDENCDDLEESRRLDTSLPIKYLVTWVEGKKKGGISRRDTGWCWTRTGYVGLEIPTKPPGAGPETSGNYSRKRPTLGCSRDGTLCCLHPLRVYRSQGTKRTNSPIITIT